MKPLRIALLTALLGALSTLSLLANPADTLVIRFANKTQLIIQSADRAGIQTLSAYDLNKIVREMGLKLDSLPDGRTQVVIEGAQGNRYLKDTVLVVTRKDGSVSVTVREPKSGTTTSRSDQRPDTNEEDYKRYTRLRYRSRKGNFNVETDLAIGLNTLLTQTVLPAYPPSQYELRPLGSRYFSATLSQRPTLLRGKNARLQLYYGLSLAWNNFMFEDPVRPTRGNDQIVFSSIQEAVKRSKLTICNLELPVVPRISFYNNSGRKSFHVGVGGFIGYRLDSYTKVRFATNQRQRDHDGLFINDLRYGLMGHLGILGTNLFVKYDLNPVFEVGKGPDVRALSFGISL